MIQRLVVVWLVVLLTALQSVSAQTVVRGPYLQRATSDSITVSWRTDIATQSSVYLGDAPGTIELVELDAGLRTEHRVLVTGLTAATRYYYAVGDSAPLEGVGDESYSFVTAPLAGQGASTRIWVIGDSGTADANARNVRDAFRSYASERPADLMLMLGDNAYRDGTDEEYQAAVFDMYPQTLRQTPVWPTLGNHDGFTADSATQSGPYYDIFDLPTEGEAGGVPSGTEAYYSFDHGDIHFVCLESYETDRSTAGAMMSWLENDLAANDKTWTIAFWHHPPYTKGSHDSDDELPLIQMRENALPLLESYGVDLVLSGHSHSYERSYLIDGHYGDSSSLDASMILDSGDGSISGNGGYDKGREGNEGAVYAVAGSSGKISPASLDHPAMHVSLAVLGSMVLDVNESRLNAVFLDDSGQIVDDFTIGKSEHATLAFEDGVSPAADYDGTRDASLYQATPSTNTGSSDRLEVDGNRGVNEIVTLLKWDISAVPSDVEVIGARIRLDVFNASPDDYTVVAARRDWDEGAATWTASSGQSNWEQAGAKGASDSGQASLGVVAASSTGELQVELNAVGIALIQDWLTGARPNNGFLIANFKKHDKLGIYSSEGPGAKPRLEIDFVATASSDLEPPTAPANLLTTHVGATQLVLAWTASNDNAGVSEYRVRRDGVDVGTTQATSLVVTALQPASSYTFDVVALDAAGNASPVSTPITVSTLGGTCTGLVKEAESANLFGAFAVRNDTSASGGKYISVQNGSGNSTNGPALSDRAEFCFSVSIAGTYRLDAFVRAPSGADDSFWVSDVVNPDVTHLWDIRQTAQFALRSVASRGGADPVEFSLEPGEYNVVVHNREDGSELDELRLVLVSADVNAAPVFTDPGDRSSGEGQAVSFSLSVSDADGDALTFTADNLPPGVTLSQDGVISGSPTVGSQGSYSVVVIVSDGVTSVEQNFLWVITAVADGECSGLAMEAEDGNMQGAFVAIPDTEASGGFFVMAPPGTGSATTAIDANHRVDYCFTVVNSGNYRLLARVLAPSGLDDSFWVTVDGGPAGGYLWDLSSGTEFGEDILGNRGGADPVEVFLDAGEHNVTIFLREDGSGIDHLSLVPTTVAGEGIAFEDVSASAGIDYVGESRGASWGDFDNDGRPDLWVSNHAFKPTLYRNQGNGTFEDVTDIIESTTLQLHSHGAAWADFDNDGDQDLVSVGPNQLLLNVGDELQNRAPQRGLDYGFGLAGPINGRSALWFDWNNDGLLDVLFANRFSFGSATALFTQGATGAFVHDNAQAGLTASGDNVVGQITHLTDQAYPALLLHGDNPYPNGIFRYDIAPMSEVSGELGVAPTWHVSDVAIADFDGDLMSDIYMVRNKLVADYAQPRPDVIMARFRPSGNEHGVEFRADGALTFEVQPTWEIDEEAIFFGAAGTHPTSRIFTLDPNNAAVHGAPSYTAGVDFGVFIAYDDLSSTWRVQASAPNFVGINVRVSASSAITQTTAIGFTRSTGELPDRLLLQNGSGFDDASVASGVSAPNACESVAAGDFDNDMDVDLYLVCHGPAANLPNILYENVGAGVFQALVGAGGAEGSSDGRGDRGVVADYDGDGFLDIFLQNGRGHLPLNRGPDQLFRNVGNNNSWLKIDLVGTTSNRDGIGARLFLSAGGTTQLREQNGGAHRNAQDHARVHFGLGIHTMADELLIEWPSGITQVLTDIPANQVLTVTEPTQ